METIFTRLESEVRSYCRSFPAVFTTASGAYLYDEDERAYLDFFCGAGALNYGHNNPRFKRSLVDYLEMGGVVHSLDLFTVAKRSFLERLESVILLPRKFDYKVQFPGPTGTNAVEAALKLARKVTGRTTILAFSQGYHGMTLGALATTGSRYHRSAAGVPLNHVVRMPYDGFFGPERDTLADLEVWLDSTSSGVDLPAAILLETVQAEGGVNPARFPWLRRLADMARDRGILLIVDDIQVGCGRTGPFFSFEPAQIQPDIVCLSKSLSGYGLPLSLVLLRRDIDVWNPGEHNGTFRGHNLAFVTATAALDYWLDDTLELSVRHHGERVRSRLEAIAARHPETIDAVRGRGLIWGLPFRDPEHAASVSRRAFELGLLIEVVGPSDEVVKLLPPLTVTAEELDVGLDLIDESVEAVLERSRVACA